MSLRGENFLACRFEKSQYLFALDRARVDSAQVFLPLHFPYRRYAAFFFDSLIRNILGRGRFFHNRLAWCRGNLIRVFRLGDDLSGRFFYFFNRALSFL